MKFGAHVSISGGIDKAPGRANELGCECFQIFTRSPRGGKPSRLDSEVIDRFFKDCERYGFDEYYVHTPYFINLASSDRSVRERSVKLVREDLERSSNLRVAYIMTHLGSSKGMKRDEAIKNVSESVKRILDGGECYTKLLLENSAGQGDTIGDRFEELEQILDDVNHEHLYICLDTAHMFAAGYDLRNTDTFKESFRKLDSIIGTDKVKLLHGNDSKTDMGEKKDRHEYVGKGKIGIECFRKIISFKPFDKVNMIVENPPEGVGDDIKRLKSLRDGDT